ncbi:MAG: hypothetical protein LBP79_05515 [Clostridiales bacterium]|jgi:hypothetical protein|nr:hypothetical protein [Clostridiales bacterium]
MSAKIGINKILIFVVSLALALVGFTACVSKVTPTGTIKTEAWEGNRTLEQVLDTVAGVQENGKDQDFFSVETTLEFYAGERLVVLRFQANFNLDDSAEDEMLLELVDETDEYIVIGGIYSKNREIYITSGNFNFTIEDVDLLNGVAGALSKFFAIDVGDVLGGISIEGMDITAILGGVLFPSAVVTTRAPLRGQSGDTYMTVEAQMDLDALVSVVLGVTGMVNDAVLSAMGVDLNQVLEDLTGMPLISVTDGEGVITKQGYDDFLAEIIGVKDGGKPFAGTTLVINLVNGELSDVDIIGKYAKAGESSVSVGAGFRAISVSPEKTDIIMPDFVSDFDFGSIRLVGEGTLPEIGEVDIILDLRIKPDLIDGKDANEISYIVNRKDNGELVMAGYYKEGSIYLDLSTVTIPQLGGLSLNEMGLGKLKIDGVDLQALLAELVGAITDAATGLADGILNGDGEPASAAVYAIGADDGVTVDVNYLFGILVAGIGTGDGEIYFDLASSTIEKLLTDLGVANEIDKFAGKSFYDAEGEPIEELQVIADALSFIGVDLIDLLDGLGGKVEDFVNGLGLDIRFSALYKDGLGLKVDVNAGDADVGDLTLRVAKYGDGSAKYYFPSDLDAYRTFDYSNISFSGAVLLPGMSAESEYTLVVSNIDNIDELAVSWTVSDQNGADIIGVYYYGGTLYANLGAETEILGFTLGDLNLDKIAIDIEEFINGMTNGESGIPATSADESAAPTLDDIIAFFDITELGGDGKTGFALTNEGFLGLVEELVGSSLYNGLKSFLPPVEAYANASLFELLFGFELGYFEEKISFTADFKTVYFGLNAEKGVYSANKIEKDSEEAKSYINMDELFGSVSFTGKIDLLGADMKKLDFELIVTDILDLDNLKLSFEATVGSTPFFSLYYDQAEKNVYLDVGLVELFGLSVIDMNIGKIIVPNVDLAGILSGSGEVPSASADESGDSPVSAEELFSWLSGEYRDGVISLGLDQTGIKNLLQKILSESLYAYIGAILPPSEVSAVLNSEDGYAALNLAFAAENMGFTLSGIKFAADEAKSLSASDGYVELSEDILLGNIALSGRAAIPGTSGLYDFELIVTGLNDPENFAFSLETKQGDALGLSVYYIRAEKSAYFYFGEFDIFAFDPAVLNMRKIKLVNIDIDPGAVIPSAESGAAGAADEGSGLLDGLDFAELLEEIFGMVTNTYNNTSGVLTLGLSNNNFGKIIDTVLGEYPRLLDIAYDLIPGFSFSADWDSAQGSLGFGLTVWDALESGINKEADAAAYVSGIAFGFDETLPNNGGAAVPQNKESFLTLEQLFRHIQINGTGSVAGAGEVDFQINLDINLENTANAEFSFIANNADGIVFALYNFGNDVYADISGIALDKLNPGAILREKIVISGLNAADVINGIIGDLLGSFSDIGSETAGGIPSTADEGEGPEDAFKSLYDILDRLNPTLSLLGANIELSPAKIEDLLSTVLEMDLGFVFDQFLPGAEISLDFSDFLNIGFDAYLNYNTTTQTKETLFSFRLNEGDGLVFGSFESYLDVKDDAAFKTVDQILAEFQLRARVEADVTLTLDNGQASEDTVENFINNILGAATDDDSGDTAWGPLGEIDIVYTDREELTYGFIADVKLDPNDIKNTDVLIELYTGKNAARRLMFGFYIDDGIGFIDLTGLVGAAEYGNKDGLRLAVNEVNIMGILKSIIPETLAATASGAGGVASVASDVNISLPMSIELLKNILGLLANKPAEDAEIPIPNLGFENFKIDLNNFTASGTVSAFGTAARPQITLDVAGRLDAAREGAVDFGSFKANKNLFVLVNAKYGLGDFAGILTILDNSLSTSAASRDMFNGNILVQNKESLATGKSDFNQTSSIYIFKIKEGGTSGSNDPMSSQYNYSGLGLNNALGILIDTSYNFTIRTSDLIPDFPTTGTNGSSNSVSYKSGAIVTQGDLDLAYFFALKETSLEVYARIGGEIRVGSNISVTASALSVDASADIKTAVSGMPIPMYTQINLTSLSDLSLRNIAGGIALPDGAKPIVTGAEEEPAEEASAPLIEKTTVKVAASETTFTVGFNPVALDKAILSFEESLLGSLAPGATVDIANGSGNRYVADTVWDGVSAMIIGFVMSEGGRNPTEVLQDAVETGSGGGGNSGKDDMQNFINALLPLPRLDETSTATLTIIFKNGRISQLDASFDGVGNEKLVLSIKRNGYSLIAEGDNLGLNQATSVSSVNVTSYSTADAYENIKHTAVVTYDGGVSRAENIAWDFSEVRAVIASGALGTKGVDGKNAKFTVRGVVGNTGYSATMTLYILNGQNDADGTVDAPGGYAFANPNVVHNVDPYNAQWRSGLTGSYQITFMIDIGGSGTTTISVGVAWDTGGVSLAGFDRDYTAYISWNGLREARTVHVNTSAVKTVKTVTSGGQPIPATQFRVTNDGSSYEGYGSATVKFNDDSSYTYPVSWSGSIGSYGVFKRVGKITTPTETYTIEQTVTCVMLVTNHVEYRNGVTPGTAGNNDPLRLNNDGANNGRIWYIAPDGTLSKTTVSSINLNGAPTVVGEAVNVNRDGVAGNGSKTIVNGGNTNAKLLVTVNAGNGLPAGTVFRIGVSYGSSYANQTGTNGDDNGSPVPTNEAGQYVDASPESTGANVYTKVIAKGTALTSSDMPTMVLRATIGAWIQITISGLSGTGESYMVTAKGVPDLKINWDFTGLDVNTPGEYTVNGFLFYRDTTQNVSCKVTVTE